MPGGAEWLERLPRLIEECAGQWSLELEPRMAGGYASFVAPVGEAVLKISFPHPEAEHEADALRAWGGDGAVRLLAHDPERWALLVERCRLGSKLIDLDDDGVITILAGLLPRLWIEPPPEIRRLSDLAERWVVELPAMWKAYERPFEPTLLEMAVRSLSELGPTQGALVLANEDLHAGNILRAQREPWLVIDPKPVAAEREFTVVAIIRDVREHVPRRRWAASIQRRLDRLSSELDLDRERVRGWTLAHTIAWGFGPDGSFDGEHAEIARLLMAA